jgi:hypothetical protein
MSTDPYVSIVGADMASQFMFATLFRIVSEMGDNPSQFLAEVCTARSDGYSRIAADGCRPTGSHPRARQGDHHRSVGDCWGCSASLNGCPSSLLAPRATIAIASSGSGRCSAAASFHGAREFTDAQRDAVVAAYPRGASFKEDIIGAFYQGMKHRPDSTFGTVNDDVLAYRDPAFKRTDFCSIILQSSWRS